MLLEPLLTMRSRVNCWPTSRVISPGGSKRAQASTFVGVPVGVGVFVMVGVRVGVLVRVGVWVGVFVGVGVAVALVHDGNLNEPMRVCQLVPFDVRYSD